MSWPSATFLSCCWRLSTCQSCWSLPCSPERVRNPTHRLPSGWGWGALAGVGWGWGEQVTHTRSSPHVPGGYYLTSLSASLALLSGLDQAHTLPLSPAQELQRSLSLWEQRCLPATHSFQVREVHPHWPARGIWHHLAQARPLPSETQQGNRSSTPCGTHAQASLSGGCVPPAGAVRSAPGARKL